MGTGFRVQLLNILGKNIFPPICLVKCLSCGASINKVNKGYWDKSSGSR